MDSNHIALSSAPVEGQLLPPAQFYYKWSQLNGVQEHSLNFIMTYNMKCKTAFKNNERKPWVLYIHLTGRAGMEKSILIDVIIEYVKRNFKCHGQTLEQSTYIVTAFTGKAASHLNGLTIHSAFHSQINGNNNSNAKFCPPCKEVLQILWQKYQYLKIIHDDRTRINVP